MFYLDGNIESVLSMMDEFESFEDWPWPLVYKEAFVRYPNAKFILTTRLSDDVWYDSLSGHVLRRKGGEDFKYRKYIYGYENPLENKQRHIDVYRKHNNEVRSFFSENNENFLEICWEKGDGWEKLCGFLDEPVPNISLPHANKKPGNSILKFGILSRARNKALRVVKKIHG